MKKGLIRSASLTNFGEVARQVGLDPKRLLREFELPQGCLTELELKVPIGAVRQLLEAAAERSGVEAFGLMMAETRPLSNLGPVGLLVREQPTVRRALETLARYAKHLNEALFLTIEDGGDVVVVREELIVGRVGPVRQSTELAIGVVFCMLRTLLGPLWKPQRVCFAHDAPINRSVHERVFRCSVEFSHDFNGIVCARSDLEVRNPNVDHGMARYARQLLDARKVRAVPPATTQVRDVVVLLLGKGPCTIDIVAQHLGVDRRTIHRRLAAERQTFSAIVDRVRRELAARYLKDGDRTMTEISSLLGFAAPSGFSRWHRQHFNKKASQRGPKRLRRRPPAPR